MPSRYRLAGYLTGATLARTGDELSGPALLLLGLTAGPGAGSALLAGLTAAAAAGSPVFGVLLDRSPAPGRLLAVALAGYAGGIALVTVVFGHLPLWSVVGLAVLTGLLNPAIAGGWTAQLPSVVGGRPRSAANRGPAQLPSVMDVEPDRPLSAANSGSHPVARRGSAQPPSVASSEPDRPLSATNNGSHPATRREPDQLPTVLSNEPNQPPSAANSESHPATRREQGQLPAVASSKPDQPPSATNNGSHPAARRGSAQPPSATSGEADQPPSAARGSSRGWPQLTSTTGDREPQPRSAAGEPPTRPFSAADKPSAAGTAASINQPPPVGNPVLATASRLDAMTFTAAALAGPGLAGLLANLAGASTALAVAVAMVAAALPVAWRLPRRPRPKATRLEEQLKAGFTVVLRNAPLRRATITSTLSCAGIGMVTVCYPLLGAAHLGGAANGALLMTVLAVASLLANAVFRGKPDTVVWASTLVLAASCALAATANSPALLIAAAVLAGFAEGSQLTALFAIRHRETPELVRAQVFTTAASVKITGLAVGAAVAGPLSAAGTGTCLITAAAIQLLAAFSQVRRPSPGRAASPRCRGSSATR
ncbi:hypothetical protein ACIOD2_27460 [Amycolatopsis sp. NPDC088138]|uniref:hypothetical protein n=1 Tax=Amycolatopsis sp. NPDC088138 TaxID=3363938 RepID=UPI00380E0699